MKSYIFWTTVPVSYVCHSMSLEEKMQCKCACGTQNHPTQTALTAAAAAKHMHKYVSTYMQTYKQM